MPNTLRMNYLKNQFSINVRQGNADIARRLANDLLIRGMANREDFEKNLEVSLTHEKNLYYYDAFHQSFGKFSTVSEYKDAMESGYFTNNGFMYRSDIEEDEFINYAAQYNNFFNSKRNIKSEGCDSPIISKKDIIKCASETDQEDIPAVEKVIEQVWSNKYFDSLFSFLSLMIAEGIHYNFLFSNIFDGEAVKREHLISSVDLETLVHESYHSLQNLLFDKHDFYQNYYSDSADNTQIHFENSAREVCLNIIKFLSVDIKQAEASNLNQLLQVIQDKLPISELLVCNPEFNRIAADLNNDDLSYYNDFLNNGEEFSSFTELMEKSKEYCNSLSKKYNLPSAILERISYFTLEGSLDELMPVTFELMAKAKESNILGLFQPMIDFFEENVMPIIDSYKKLHVEHYCSPLLDLSNKQSIFSTDNYSGQCISDFIDFIA